MAVIVFVVWERFRPTKESEFYTDYIHGTLILRIFKPEFEYQAIGNVDLRTILDRGVLSQNYFWVLIEKPKPTRKHDKQRKGTRLR